MTDHQDPRARYRSLATPVAPAQADDLRRQLHARLTAAGPEAALITTQPEPLDSEEEVLMSIEQLDRTESSQRARRTRVFAIGAGVALAAAAVAAVAIVISDGDDDALAPTDAPAPTNVSASTLAPAPTAAPTTLPPPVCIGGEGQCRGDLAPGTYTSTLFQPGVTYTVGDGWRNVEDTAGVLGMTVETTRGLVDVYVVSRVSVPQGCEVVADPAVGPTSADIAMAYGAAEELVASTPQPVTVGGLTGVMMDVSMNPAWTGTCPGFPDPSPGAFHIIGVDRSAGFERALFGPGEAERLYLLDYDGGTLAVQIHTPSVHDDEARAVGPIAEYIDEIQPFIDSLDFDGVG